VPLVLDFPSYSTPRTVRAFGHSRAPMGRVCLSMARCNMEARSASMSCSLQTIAPGVSPIRTLAKIAISHVRNPSTHSCTAENPDYSTMDDGAPWDQRAVKTPRSALRRIVLPSVDPDFRYISFEIIATYAHVPAI